MATREDGARTEPRHLAAHRRPSAADVAWVAASALVLALTCVMCVWNLGGGVVWNADESRHAINAYEMLRAGDPIVNTYNGEGDYWNLKPPLSMWTIMASYLAFGFNAFALRFPSALAWILTVALAWLFLWRRFGRAEALAGAAMMLTCTFVWGWHFARSGDADALYVLFFSCSMLCLMLSMERGRWVYLSGLFVGLAFLTKASHALLLFPLVLLCLLATRTIRRYRVREVAGFFACAVVPVLAWASVRASRDGLDFLAAMFGTDVADRVSDAVAGNAGPVTMYARMLLSDPGPLAAVLAALCAAALALVARRRGSAAPLGAPRARALVCLALWAALPVAAFSLVPTKHIWYVYPSLPPLLMLGGVGVVSLGRRARRGPVVPRAASAVALAACAALAGLGLLRSLPIALGGQMLGRWGVSTISDVCGDGALQPGIARAWQDGELPYGATAFVDYGDSTELDPMISGHGLRQGTFAVAEWYGDARVEGGGIPAFLSHDGPCVLFVTDEVLAARAAELEGCPVVVSAGGYSVLARG